MSSAKYWKQDGPYVVPLTGAPEHWPWPEILARNDDKALMAIFSDHCISAEISKMKVVGSKGERLAFRHPVNKDRANLFNTMKYKKSMIRGEWGNPEPTIYYVVKDDGFYYVVGGGTRADALWEAYDSYKSKTDIPKFQGLITNGLPARQIFLWVPDALLLRIKPQLNTESSKTNTAYELVKRAGEYEDEAPIESGTNKDAQVYDI